MFCVQEGIPKPVQGIDFEFQMFGGALLDSLCLNTDDVSQEDEMKKLVEMFSFSRNAYVVIDSDAVEREGVLIDNSCFRNAKQFIKRQFDDLIRKGFALGIWYNEFDPDVYSIEDHLDDETLTSIGKRKGSKVVYARRVVRTWGDDKLLREFKADLTPRIADMVECIREWNSDCDGPKQNSGSIVS